MEMEGNGDQDPHNGDHGHGDRLEIMRNGDRHNGDRDHGDRDNGDHDGEVQD